MFTCFFLVNMFDFKMFLNNISSTNVAIFTLSTYVDYAL